MGILYLFYLAVGWPVFFFILVRQFRRLGDITLLGMIGIAALAAIPPWREIIVLVLWAYISKLDLEHVVVKQKEEK